MFDTFNNIEYNENIIEEHFNKNIGINTKKKVNNFYKCRDCDGNLIDNININKVVCDKCNRQYDLSICQNLDSSIITSKNNYSTSSTVSIGYLVNGNYSLKQISIHTSVNYEKNQRRKTYKQVKNIAGLTLNYYINENLVNETTDFFHSIQKKGIIVRTQPRLGLLAACFNIVCLKNNFYISRCDICTIFNVSSHYLSRGESLLIKLGFSGIISYIELTTDFYIEKQLLTCIIKLLAMNNNDYIDENLILYNNNNYNFCHNLIKFIIKFRINISSQTTTKIASALFCLSICQNEINIKEEDIIKVCNINKGTYFKTILQLKKILNTDIDYLIPMKKKLMHLFNKYKLNYNKIKYL